MSDHRVVTPSPPAVAELLPRVQSAIAEARRTRAPIDREPTDAELVARYLREIENADPPCRPNTIRRYRQVLVRFLTWYAAHCYGRALRDFARDDALDYREFMRAPPADWISYWTDDVKDADGKVIRKGRYQRRPFGKALEEQDVVLNEQIIRGMFDYLQAEGRVSHNPFRNPKGVPHGMRQQQTIKTERYLDDRTWEALWLTINDLERRIDNDRRPRARTRAMRQRWALLALYIGALRADECARSTAGQIRWRPSGVWLHLPAAITKSAYEAEIPLPQLFLDELARYRRHHGIVPHEPGPGDPWPLVLDLRGRRGITSRQLYNLVVEVMREAADRLTEEADRLDAKEKKARERHEKDQLVHRARILRAASPHWLRHSRATHLLDEGADRRIVKAIMRHTNDQTLDQYVHADDSATQEQSTLRLEGLVPEIDADAIDPP